MAEESVEFTLTMNLDVVASQADTAKAAMNGLNDSTVKAGVSAIQSSEKFHAMSSAVSRAAMFSGTLKSSLTQLNMITPETAKGLERMTAVANLVEAPMNMIINLARVASLRTLEFALATGALTTGIMAVGATFAAMHAEGEKEKRLFSVLAGVTWGLTAAQAALAVAKSAAATLGIAALATAAVTAGAIAAVIAGVGTYAAASYQTSYGEEKIVPTTQVAVVHQGEHYYRGAGGRGGGVQVHIYGDPDRNTLWHAEKMVQRALDRSGF